MASNGKGRASSERDIGRDIEAANENTGLLQNNVSPDTSSSQQSGDDRLWAEMDQPWPATFERSISLLASPIINAVEVDEFTKSPKPGNTTLANRRRQVRLEYLFFQFYIEL